MRTNQEETIAIYGKFFSDHTTIICHAKTYPSFNIETPASCFQVSQADNPLLRVGWLSPSLLQ